MKSRRFKINVFLLNLPDTTHEKPYVYDLNDPIDVGLMELKKKLQQNRIDYLESKLLRERLQQKEKELWANYKSVGSKDSKQELIIDLYKDDEILNLERQSLSFLDLDDEVTGEFIKISTVCS